MVELQEEHLFAPDDDEMDGDNYIKLWVNGEVWIEGDYYHDKIQAKIEGFKSALDYLDVEWEEEKPKRRKATPADGVW